MLLCKKKKKNKYKFLPMTLTWTINMDLSDDLSKMNEDHLL